MEPLRLSVRECRGVRRQSFVVEQGVPVLPLPHAHAAALAVVDRSGRPVPANVQVEGVDQHGNARWVLVSLPVDMDAGAEAEYYLIDQARQPEEPGLDLDCRDGHIAVSNAHFSLFLDDPGRIRLATDAGDVLNGPISMDLRSDARSAVGNQRPVRFEPCGYRVVERTHLRVKVLLSGRYAAWTPKSFDLDPGQRFDVEIELVVHACSPVIRLRWRITDQMEFNCFYLWLDRYVLSFPLAEGSDLVLAHDLPGEAYHGEWAIVRTPGGQLGMTFPFRRWLGPGSGIEFTGESLGQGGIAPPPDGGFGGRAPAVYRMFYKGMSRTFEGALLVNPTPDQVQSELNPVPLIVPPDHYSHCGELPEDGGRVTFGPWRSPVQRAADWLIENQWKSTLWFGEWWREWDVDHNLGVEETNSGNSALAPLYHFFRTGDWRFWEAAKMSCLYTYDIQFCKREDGLGPYMHTRRFLLDHQEWFHPRYQRVGGIIKPGHLFGYSQDREKVFWMLRWWAERYFDEDGAPMLPDRHGNMERLTERAMGIIGDSMAHAYVETGDQCFLEAAAKLGNWIVNSMEGEGWEQLAENANSTRYILQGLLPLCKLTDDQRYRRIFVKLSECTLSQERFDFGTHYFAFHFYLASVAYKLSGRSEILDGILDVARWVLAAESGESPGTYPFLQKNQYPAANWICSYDNLAITAYLPALASALAEAGIPAAPDGDRT